MSPWFLLVLTVACAALTLDAFRWGAPLKDQPFRFWPKEWRRGTEHLPLAEQERIDRVLRPSTLGPGVLAWLFLAMTILLAVLTILGFIE
jgi:hypothetical protein